MTSDKREAALLDSVLRMVEVRGAVFVQSRFTAPWGVSIAAEGMTFFHIVTQGRSWLEVEGSPKAIRLDAGDLVIMPHGTLHRLRDDLSTPTESFEQVFTADRIGPDKSLICGGGGEPTTMVCGEFRFADRKTDPLLFALPDCVRIPGLRGEAAPWLRATLDWVADELTTNAPGAETVVQRLTDILFIQAARNAYRSGDLENPGWLRGLRDEKVAHALFLIHERPQHPWTVRELAARIGVSRSGLAGRFAELVGDSPMRYLTRWRLNKAASLMRVGDASVAEAAAAVGYDSEASFSKAFKRHTGTAPGAYRDGYRLPAEGARAAAK